MADSLIRRLSKNAHFPAKGAGSLSGVLPPPHPLADYLDISHTLLNLKTFKDLEGHPKVGASWEGFAMGQVIRCLGVRRDECYFWATHGGAELDLLVVRGQKRLGFEFKRTSSPAVTPSLRSALSDLHLESLDIIHAGEITFPLDSKIRAIALTRILEDIKPLK